MGIITYFMRVRQYFRLWTHTYPRDARLWGLYHRTKFFGPRIVILIP